MLHGHVCMLWMKVSTFHLLSLTIFTEIYEPVLNANRLANKEKRMLKIKKLIHDLPESNFETFRYLCEHLNIVAACGQRNKVSQSIWIIRY